MQEEKVKGRMREGEEGSETARRLREKWLSRAVRALTEAAFVGGAWILGQAQLLFGTCPLGLALLCGTGKHTLAILAGLLLSAAQMGELSLIYVCAYLAAALVRVLSSILLDSPDTSFSLPENLAERLERGAESEADGEEEEVPLGRHEAFLRQKHTRMGSGTEKLLREARSIFSESVCLRMGAAGVAALLVSLYRIISGGFRYYDFFAAIFCVAVAASATAVFSVALERQCSSRVLCKASEVALLFSAVYAASGITLLGFPLAPLLSLFATLAVSHRRGAVEGIATGTVCGLAYAPLWIPAYLAAALLYIFFHSMEKENAAILLACFSSVVWMTYTSSVSILLWAIPSALLSGAAFTLYCRVAELGACEEEEAETETEERGADARQMGDVRYRDANERFRGISDAFSSLSEVFYNLSDRLRRPGSLDLRRVCDGAFDSVCADCPNKSVCWGVAYSDTLQSLNSLISALHTKGRVTEAELGQALSERCARSEAILSEVNRECARLTGELLRNNRTEIFAMDYEGAAQIINEALLCEDEEYCTDPSLERRVAVYLSDAGVETTGVSVFGKRQRRVLVRGADVEGARVSLETLRSDLGEMCDSDFCAPIFEVENGVSSMVFRARQKLSVKIAKKNISADGGVSGDSINLFVNKREYFYALISDGMGAGREAALTSGLCSVFMEKMLRAGNRAATSLRMLNNMIRSRGADSASECSSTIDLLELDLMTGKCTFFKSGAAPSFVIRGGVVRRMQSGSAPIGIMCALDSRETAFDLRCGDTVVMISDGILDAEGESDSLIPLLTETGKMSPQELVDRICAAACAKEEHDDCSAVVLRIESYEEE